MFLNKKSILVCRCGQVNCKHALTPGISLVKQSPVVSDVVEENEGLPGEVLVPVFLSKFSHCSLVPLIIDLFNTYIHF